MKRLALLLLLLFAVACSAGERGPGIDVDAAVGHARALTERGPRPGDTAASEGALAYIEEQLRVSKIASERVPVGTVELPAITVLGQTYRHARAATSRDPNLVVTLGPSRGDALLVIAHYDSVTGSPGAVDNAAAVGALIELARRLRDAELPQPVVLAFTANEEDGLVGAEALALARGQDIGFAIALDLIGGDGELSINGAGVLIGDAELSWLADAADEAGVVVRAPLAHRVVSRWWPQAERSDHGPFTRRGVRAVHLYNRGHDGEWIDRAYHSERDTIDRVTRDSVDDLGRVLVALAGAPIPARGGDGFWLPVVANTVIPRWILVGAEALLAALAVLALIAARGPLVRGGLGLAAGTIAFGFSAAASIAVERIAAGAHPAPWIHAPSTWQLALAAILVGTLGLVTTALRRVRPWTGEARYLAVAVGIPLVVGIAWLALGAAELAWVWLVPAALVGGAAHLPPRSGAVAGALRIVAVLTLALPLALVLSPNQLREAAWNGFLPTSMPLAGWLALLGAPLVAGVAWLLRRRTTGPLGAFVLPVGCLLAIITGVIVVSRAHGACSAPDFNQFHLACEVPPRVR